MRCLSAIRGELRVRPAGAFAVTRARALSPSRSRRLHLRAASPSPPHVWPAAGRHPAAAERGDVRLAVSSCGCVGDPARAPPPRPPPPCAGNLPLAPSSLALATPSPAAVVRATRTRGCAAAGPACATRRRRSGGAAEWGDGRLAVSSRGEAITRARARALRPPPLCACRASQSRSCILRGPGVRHAAAAAEPVGMVVWRSGVLASAPPAVAAAGRVCRSLVFLAHVRRTSADRRPRLRRQGCGRTPPPVACDVMTWEGGSRLARHAALAPVGRRLMVRSL